MTNAMFRPGVAVEWRSNEGEPMVRGWIDGPHEWYDGWFRVKGALVDPAAYDKTERDFVLHEKNLVLLDESDGGGES